MAEARETALQPASSSEAIVFHWRKGVDPREGKHPGLPVKPNRVVLQGSIEITYDVQVIVRDGNKLEVDFFKPEGEREKLPVKRGVKYEYAY
jgi:predicted acyl esterase